MRSLRTLKGSVIERYQGTVGKRVGEWLYLHRSYIDKLPAELVSLVWRCEGTNLLPKYNTIKISLKRNIVVFMLSPDFDSADEPTAGEYCRVTLPGKGCGSQPVVTAIRRTSNIWHHKWLWVTDDYEGFDVEASFQRSQVWLALDDVDMARIGNPKYWATVESRI